ncbi:MAG: dihydropteroate synthase [Bacteroidota bacterium]
MIYTTPRGYLDLSSPKVMGILNVTPDSFYAGNRSMRIDSIVRRAEEMIDEGVDIVDIGGMSTRPGSVAPDIAEEMKRVDGPLRALRDRFPDLLLSIDTYRAEVLSHALDIGVDLVNDVSAGSLDTRFLSVVAESGLPYVLMHMQGKPATMQANPQYHDVTRELFVWLKEKLDELHLLGIQDVIIDVGFGFGKSVKDNYRLLTGLSVLQILDKPIMVGLSRKSMIYNVTNSDPNTCLHGTTAAHMLALQQGAKLLRVHDVLPAKQAIQIHEASMKV